MSKEKTWGDERFAQILKDAREKYGRGWDHLSQDQRQCFIDSRILALVMGQASEKFAPAQDLAQQVFAAARVASEASVAATDVGPLEEACTAAASSPRQRT